MKYLTLTDPTKVWMPDTFFRNEKEARKHEIIVPNVYVRIFPDGEILYSIRLAYRNILVYILVIFILVNLSGYP